MVSEPKDSAKKMEKKMEFVPDVIVKVSSESPLTRKKLKVGISKWSVSGEKVPSNMLKMSMCMCSNIWVFALHGHILQYLMILLVDSKGPDQTALMIWAFFPCQQNTSKTVGARGLKLEFVCVEVLRPSQPNGVMSSAVSLPNRTFTGQA